MKIGIITFWQSNDNYGQLLQCWAMQQVLKGMGHEPFLIRYNYHEYYDDAPLWKRVARIILILPYFKRQKLKRKKINYKIKNACREFDKFREEHLIKSEQYYFSPDILKQNPPEADVYITGSDQVWAQLLGNKRVLPSFLDFGPDSTRRISYAPSFARKVYPAKLERQLREALSRFDAISVRERDGVNICKKVGYDAVHVIDPTLLLDKSKYIKLITAKSTISGYIYIYSINIADASEVRWSEIRAYSQRLGLSIIVTPGSGYFEGKELFGDEVTYDYSTIHQWLSNIANAKMLVTTSFHGTVFSLILHCPVIYVPLKGHFASGNNRAEELLRNVGLENRILSDNVNIEACFVNKIDWAAVDARLSIMRIHSLEFLNKSLI